MLPQNALFLCVSISYSLGWALSNGFSILKVLYNNSYNQKTDAGCQMVARISLKKRKRKVQLCHCMKMPEAHHAFFKGREIELRYGSVTCHN